MNVKKLVLAWLAGFAVMFLLSGLWYELLMADYYNVQFADVERIKPLFLWIVIGYLIGSFLLAYIYPIGYKGGPPVKEGMKFGFFMGLIMILPIELILYGVHTVPLGATFIDIIYQVLEKTIGGTFIGLVYGTISQAGSD